MAHINTCTCDHCHPKDHYPAFEMLVRERSIDGITGGLEFFTVLDRKFAKCLEAMKKKQPSHKYEVFKEFSLIGTVSMRNGDSIRMPTYELIIEKTDPEERCFAYSFDLFLCEGEILIDYTIDEMPGPEANNNLAKGRLGPLRTTVEVLNAADQVATIFNANI